MKVIAGGRQTGRTTELIKLAAEAEAKGEIHYIVCHTQQEAYRIFDRAYKMNLKIGFPITLDEFLKGGYTGANIRGFYIDNAEMLLQSLTHVPIRAITILDD